MYHRIYFPLSPDVITFDFIVKHTNRISCHIYLLLAYTVTLRSVVFTRAHRSVVSKHTFGVYSQDELHTHIRSEELDLSTRREENRFAAVNTF